MRYFSLSPLTNSLSVLCLGASHLGSRETEDESFALLDQFFALGGTFLDTANVYADWLPNGHGASERTIGRWLRSRGMTDRVAVATKGGHPRLETMQIARLRPEDIAHDIEESRERLGVDTIDLYYLHRDDPSVPVGELLGALNEHLAVGAIRAIGASNWRVNRLREASDYVSAHALTGFCASQIKWSLKNYPLAFDPATGAAAMDNETLAFHCESKLRQIPYSTQAGGYFARPCPDAVGTLNYTRWQRTQEIARQYGITPNQVALAYILCHPCGGAAVVGPHTSSQMADTCAGADFTLIPEEVRYLEGKD